MATAARRKPVSTQTALLCTIAEALDGADIPHMVAGSFASAVHGEPRLTRDIDLVIDPPTADHLHSFVTSLPTDRFYVGDHQRALAERDMFNVIDHESGWKIDLIIRRDRPFSVAEMARRRPVQIGDCVVAVASAEDTVLTKLEWATITSSERQLDDVRAILSHQDLDHAYLRRWAEELGLSESLENALRDSA